MSTPRVTALLLTLALASPALAHPGSGLVVDRNGKVYFVVPGSNTIMRLDRDGRATPFVTDERLRLPHHLAATGDGGLFVASDDDGRVWRVSVDGTLREHFNAYRIRQQSRSEPVVIGGGGDPFTVDAAGNVFALATTAGSAIVRITPAGDVTPVARSARFGDLHFSSMAWGANGVLYLTDANRVWRIARDSATPIVPRGLQLSRATGVAIDSVGNIYVADYGGRRVVRFASDGAVNTPPRIEKLRLSSPTGVTLAGTDVYVMDSPRGGGVAIWRVRGDDATLLYGSRVRATYLRWAMPGALGILLGLLVLNAMQKRRSAKS